MTQSNQTEDAASVVVGIGASAGGVEAISHFFDHGQEDTGAAYVVIMHLAPTRASQLPEILTRHCRMPVRRAEHDMLLQPNTVYVGQPGRITTISNGRLQVTQLDLAERVPTVIDRFFNSLAESYAERAIGMVLSGTGVDGALGLKAIKDRGGLTIAQGEDGSAPLFAGMPQNAIAAGAIDLQLPVEEIAPRLSSVIAGMVRADERVLERETEETEEQRLKICALIKAQVNHDFSGYKPNTFFRRVHRRMYVLQIASIASYLEYLQHSPSEVTLLFRDLLISVTSFFRDATSFKVIEDEVIPALFSGKGRDDEVRVWVPGCATGEEAYSLGILLLEYVDTLGDDVPSLRLFATDIDERALTVARRGRYPSVLLDDVSSERRKRFFVEDHDHYTVHKRLREICTFSPHNALRDPPFSRIDMVSCRNLLIYLGPEFQDRILPILHYALKPDGFLFVGMAEGASRHKNLFVPLSKTHRIFRKLPTSASHASLPPLVGGGKHMGTSYLDASDTGRSSGAIRRRIEGRILQSHAPPYVLVNGQGEALFYSGRTGSYLEFSPGTPSNHLLSNARKELRLGLRRALQEVVTTQERVTQPEVNVPREDGLRRVQLSIEPFEGGDSPMYLVLFNDHGPAQPIPDNIDAASAHTVEQLERELRETREQLQSTYEEFETAIEELRVANEELMSVNEELQSSNEELETSKEELQSVNEEMQTVNQEMAHHVEALDQSNADLRGLLESTGIATIFLDRQLTIRRFTRAATDIFTLIPSDCGRQITDLHHELDGVDLRHCLEQTLSSGQPQQHPVARKDERKHYLMRLMPYTVAADEIGGIVITFVDITALAEADLRHKTMIGELNHRVRNMLAVVNAMATQTMGHVIPQDVLTSFLDRLNAMARTYKLLTESNWSHMSLAGMLRGELSAIAGSNRYSLHGPDVQLTPREALALGMVIHELATNALKYGALSNDQGRIDVNWKQLEQQAIQLTWAEVGGPTVVPPSHRGFGTLLLERQLAYELNGQSQLDFASTGLVVTLQIPRLTAPADNAP